MPFLLGPTVDVRIRPWLSLETGLTFNRLGQNNRGSAFIYPENSLTLIYSTLRGHAMEIPILAKMHLVREGRTWRPFVTAGTAIRHTSIDSEYASSIFSGSNLSNFTQPPGLNGNRSDWSIDPAAGAGVDFRAGRVHLEPEVRYSYWGSGTQLPVRKNQVGFLMGFRF